MNSMDQEALRQQIEEELRRQKRVSKMVFLGVNLLMFVVFISLVWGGIASTPGLEQLSESMSDTLFLAAFLPSLGWAMGLFFQFIALLMDLGIGDRQLRAQAFARVMSQRMMDNVLYGKQKREEVDLDNATVGPDGEIEYFDDEQQRTQRK
ncbi:MAG: hypothetical protein MUF87_04005 [Anaerolineae bacterium]|jgi:hypothetical protein|nr:hypothetical protein [Anaerolineae bacterium]